MVAASRLMVHVGADVNDAVRGLHRVDREVDQLKDTVNTAGRTMQSMLGGAVMGAGFAAAQVGFRALEASAGGLKAAFGGTAADFEQQMSGVKAVAGATQDEFGLLRQAAIDLGRDTRLSGVSASDAARAMEELAKGGVTVADQLGGATRSALLLAAAGEVEIAEAAEIGANAMAMFGLKGSDMARVTDLIAGAANASSLSVTDFRYSLSAVGAAASASGQSFESTATAIALMGEMGIKGQDAGTSLKVMLNNLVPSTKGAMEVMRSLGIVTADGTNRFIDANGAFKGMDQIAQVLQESLAGLTDAQRLAALEAMFGQDAQRAGIVLAKAGAEGYNRMADAMGRVTAESVAATRIDNLHGAIEQLGSSAETAAIVFGQHFLPALRDVTVGATGLIDAAIPMLDVLGARMAASLTVGAGALRELYGIFREGDFTGVGPWAEDSGIVDWAFRLREAVQALRDPLDTLNTQLIFLSFRFPELRDPILAVRDAFYGFGPIVDTVRGALEVLRDPLAFLSDQLLVLAFRFPALQEPLLTVRDLLNEHGAAVGRAAAAFLAFGPAVNVALLVLPPLLGVLTGLGPIIGILTSSFSVLGTVIGAVGLPVTLLVGAVAALGVAWHQNWFDIQGRTSEAIGTIRSLIEEHLLPAVRRVGSFLMETVVPTVQEGWARVRFIVAEAMEAALPYVERFQAFLRDHLIPGVQGIVAEAVPAFERLRVAVVEAVAEALPGLASFWSGVQTLGAVVLPILRDVAGRIVDDLGPAVLRVVEWAQVVIPQFADAWEAVWARIGPIVGTIAGLIGEGLRVVARFVSDHREEITFILGNAWDIIANTIGIAFDIISGIISLRMQLISGDWSGAWDTIRETAASVWERIAQIVSSGADNARVLMIIALVEALEGAARIWDAIVQKVSDTWDSIKAVVTLAAEKVRTEIEFWLARARDDAAFIWDTVTQKVTDTWETIVRTIGDKAREAWQKVSDFAADVLQKLSDLAIGALQRAADIGINIIEGIISGITSRIPSLNNTLTGALLGAIDAAKGILGIRSPSRVAADQIGAPIVDGIITGVQAREPTLMSAVVDLGNRVMQQLNEQARRIAERVASMGVNPFGTQNGLVLESNPWDADAGVVGWLQEAMARTGVPSDWLAGLRTIAHHESGGDPGAINNWDINAINGNPSMGLMQVIRDHFLPGEDPYNPVDNATAAIRYILSRYGSVWNVPGVVNVAQGGSYVGYAEGGVIREHIRGIGLRTGTRYEFGERGAEAVVPLSGGRGPVALPATTGAATIINITVSGNTMLSRDIETAGELARILRPELARLGV